MPLTCHALLTWIEEMHGGVSESTAQCVNARLAGQMPQLVYGKALPCPARPCPALPCTALHSLALAFVHTCVNS